MLAYYLPEAVDTYSASYPELRVSQALHYSDIRGNSDDRSADVDTTVATRSLPRLGREPVDDSETARPIVEEGRAARRIEVDTFFDIER